jgi:TRAP-type C4-dicarboxylate transport system permease large subunit
LRDSLLRQKQEPSALSAFFTPTEAGAIGAFGTLILAVVRRNLTLQGFVTSVFETTRITCMILVIVAGATIFGHFLAITRIPFDIANQISGFQLPPYAIMFLIILVYLIGGCFIDALALIMLTVPIFYPVVNQEMCRFMLYSREFCRFLLH